MVARPRTVGARDALYRTAVDAAVAVATDPNESFTYIGDAPPTRFLASLATAIDMPADKAVAVTCAAVAAATRARLLEVRRGRCLFGVVALRAVRGTLRLARLVSAPWRRVGGRACSGSGGCGAAARGSCSLRGGGQGVCGGEGGTGGWVWDAWAARAPAARRACRQGSSRSALPDELQRGGTCRVAPRARVVEGAEQRPGGRATQELCAHRSTVPRPSPLRTHLAPHRTRRRTAHRAVLSAGTPSPRHGACRWCRPLGTTTAVVACCPFARRRRQVALCVGPVLVARGFAARPAEGGLPARVPPGTHAAQSGRNGAWSVLGSWGAPALVRRQCPPSPACVALVRDRDPRPL